MESGKKHGDPLEDEIRPEAIRGVEKVEDNQPGSKGRREEEEQPLVRSVDQRPNPNQPDDDATTPAEVDLSRRRKNM